MFVQEKERETELNERRRLLDEKQRLETEARRVRQQEQDHVLNRAGTSRPRVSLSLNAPPRNSARS